MSQSGPTPSSVVDGVAPWRSHTHDGRRHPGRSPRGFCWAGGDGASKRGVSRRALQGARGDSYYRRRIVQCRPPHRVHGPLLSAAVNWRVIGRGNLGSSCGGGGGGRRLAAR
eukprot:358065-Chlamydomonas_euryale.AAC.4